MKHFLAGSAWVKPTERLRAASGALVVLALLGGLTAWLSGRFVVPLALIAPMGASSVLLFALPSSPLAQPWAVVGGNAISACCGLVAALFIPNTALAAGVGVSSAIALMASLRCLHPPGGAVALTMVLLGFKTAGAGASFALWNVGLSSLVLVVGASLFHAATGHIYPEFLRKPEPPMMAEDEQAESEIIEDVLRSSEEMVDISALELQKIYHKISLRMASLHRDAQRVGDIMVVAPEALSPGLSLSKAFDEIVAHPAHMAFVTDENARLIGALRLGDFTGRTDLRGEKIRVSVRQRLENAAALRSAPAHVVGDIMHRAPVSVRADEPISRAVVAALESSLPLVPVVDGEGRLTGIVRPEALIATLAAAPQESA